MENPASSGPPQPYLSHLLPIITPSAAPSLFLTDEDVTLGKSSTTVTLSLEVPDNEISATLQHLSSARPERPRIARELLAMRAEKRRVAEPTKRRQRIEQLKLKRSLQGLRGALAESGDQFNFQIKDLHLPEGAQPDQKTIKRAAENFAKSLQARPNQPIAVFYSPRRSLASRPRTLPAITPLTIPRAYPRALDDADVELRDFMLWFRFHESTGKKRTGSVLAQLSDVSRPIRAGVWKAAH